VTALGVMQVIPEGEETAKVTVSLKPLRAVTVTVEVAVFVAKTGLGLTGPADMLKSTMWKRTFPVVRVTGELLIVPVPVTVTV